MGGRKIQIGDRSHGRIVLARVATPNPKYPRYLWRCEACLKETEGSGQGFYKSRCTDCLHIRARERANARSLGLVRYVSDIPCPNGHTERYVNASQCVACSLARQRMKKRKRKANPEIQRKRLRDPVKRAAHVTLARNRRARQKLLQGKHTGAEITELLAKQKFKCVYCKSDISHSAHADHIVPVYAGGTNWISNIQMLCKSCNSRKHTRPHHVYAQEVGLLI